MSHLGLPEHTTEDDWLKAEVQAAIDDPGPSLAHEEVMQRMFAKISALQQEQEKRRA